MPTTSTIPPQLEQLLAELNLTVSSLSERTGILCIRLIEIYEQGKPTLQELYCLLPVLGPGFVSYLTAAFGAELAKLVFHSVQLGLFNQGGADNTQYNVVNNYVNLTVNVNYVADPQNRTLRQSTERWEAQRVQPGGQARQIGQTSPVLEVGRAA